MAVFNPLSDAFGLDIGDQTFKLVQVRRQPGQRGNFKLRAWGSIAVPPGVMERGEILDQDQASKLIGRLVHTAKGGVRGRAVVACLPEAKCFLKVINLSKDIGETEMKTAIRQEMEMSIPLPISDIYYDWQRIANPPHIVKKPPEKEKGAAPERPEDEAVDGTLEVEGAPPPVEEAESGEPKVESQTEAPPAEKEPVTEPPSDTIRVLLAVAPRKLIDDYGRMLEAAGLAPIAFEIESMAIARSLVPSAEKLDEPLGILDIGATRSSLIICDAGAIQMSISIPMSGNEITAAIAEKLEVSPEDAETIKIECGLDAHRCEDKMWNILLPLIDDMSSKIRNALRFYKIGFPDGRKIERLWLCGGGAHFRDIDTVLSRKLTIKVARADSLVNLGRTPKAFSREGRLTYTTAIGLGMRAANEGRSYRKSFRI